MTGQGMGDGNAAIYEARGWENRRVLEAIVADHQCMRINMLI
jgi:hypothetical protein